MKYPVNKFYDFEVFKATLALTVLLCLITWSMFQPSIVSFGGHISPWLGPLVYISIRIILLTSSLLLIYWLLKTPLFVKYSDRNNLSVNPSRNPLLIIRSIAFLMVLLGHWFMVTFPPAGLAQMLSSGKIVWLLTASPWGGVWIFFTLSGYLMGKGFLSRKYNLTIQGVSEFYRNRALRIFPIYYFAILLVGALVSPVVFNLSSPTNFVRLIAILTFDSLGYQPIGALWSVSTEVQFYLILPVLMCIFMPLLKNKNRIGIFFASVILISVTYKYTILRVFGLSAWHQYVFQPLLPNLDGFLIGVGLSFLTGKGSTVKVFVKYGKYCALSASFFLWITLSYWSARGMLGIGGMGQIIFLSFAPVATSLVTAFIIYALEQIKFNHPSNSPSILEKLFWKISTTIGILTYSLYVWHEPILLSFRRIIPETITLTQSILYFCLVFPFIFIISFIFYKYFELPFDFKRSTNSPKLIDPNVV